jgi:hypothetical protein
MIRVDVEALGRLKLAGATITHNPDVSANHALLAVLGELEKLSKRALELEQALVRSATD